MRKSALLAVAGMAVASYAMAAPVGVNSSVSTISSAAASATFSVLPGKMANIQLTGTASATCFLERQIDGSTWQQISVTAGGTTTVMYKYVYTGTATSEQFIETEIGALYRLDCGAQLGSYTSGTLTVGFYQ